MNRRLMPIVLTALCGSLALAACGPTILEKRILEQPDPALLRPGPSPEEQSGEVPMLEDIRPSLTLVPADHDAPKPPDDPRPVALRDAPKTAPPLPPAPARGATAAPARDTPSDQTEPGETEPDETEPDETEPDEPADNRPRRGGVRVNPR